MTFIPVAHMEAAVELSMYMDDVDVKVGLTGGSRAAAAGGRQCQHGGVAVGQGHACEGLCIAPVPVRVLGGQVHTQLGCVCGNLWEAIGCPV